MTSIVKSLADLFDHVERHQVAKQIDPPTKPQATNQSNDSKSHQDKSKDKKRKNKSSNKESDSPPPKRFCVLHQVDTHWTNDCTVMKEQAKRMHAAYNNLSPAERSRKKRERQQQQQQEKNELHEMVVHEIQQSMKDLFKTPHSTNRHESDDDTDMEDPHQDNSLNMADVEVSECYNLSDLRQPPTILVSKTFQSQGFDVCPYSYSSFHRANGIQSLRTKARWISHNTMRIDRHLRMLETDPSQQLP